MFDLSLLTYGDLDAALRNPGVVPLGEPRRTVSLRLVRNWAAEPATRRIRDYGRAVGLDISIDLSPYFDSLLLEKSVHSINDISVIWFDPDRLGSYSFQDLINDAVEIATVRPSQIICLFHPRDILVPSNTLPNLLFLEYPRLEKEQAEDATKKYGHFFASPSFLNSIADLVFETISSAVFGSYRMIAVDFDNTLYAGIVGEDGISQVKFNADHVALLAKLEELVAKGVLLTGVTKNDPEDIEGLFRVSEQYGLRKSMFFDVQASWKEKSEVIAEQVAAANLHESQVLFIDDNISELEKVRFVLPHVDLLLASSAADALKLLESGHRLPKAIDNLADLRLQDLRNRTVRQNSTVTGAEIHQVLESQVRSELASEATIPRAQELILKTNQFNMSLRRTRITGNELSKFVTAIASVSDRLGDSGIVAVIVGQLEGFTLSISEFCISCRVLGRNLEDIIFCNLLEKISHKFRFEKVRIDFEVGPRNVPAVEWLKSFSQVELPSSRMTIISDSQVQKVVTSSEYAFVTRVIDQDPVDITKIGD
jgi:FkbH-like protein